MKSYQSLPNFVFEIQLLLLRFFEVIEKKRDEGNICLIFLFFGQIILMTMSLHAENETSHQNLCNYRNLSSKVSIRN